MQTGCLRHALSTLLLPHRSCLQPQPSWGPGLAALKPSQFQPFAPSFCSEGTVQLLLGKQGTRAAPACTLEWHASSMQLHAWIVHCPLKSARVDPSSQTHLHGYALEPPANLRFCNRHAAAALDSWERLREAAAAVLLRLPTPLPGAATPAELQPLLCRGLRLLGCPRGREADAGAQLVLLLLRKYGGGWGASCSGGGCAWLLDLAEGTVQAPAAGEQQAGDEAGQQAAIAAGTAGQQAAAQGASLQDDQQAEALWCFLSSGCLLLEQRVQLAQQDMLAACR